MARNGGSSVSESGAAACSVKMAYQWRISAQCNEENDITASIIS